MCGLKFGSYSISLIIPVFILTSYFFYSLVGPPEIWYGDISSSTFNIRNLLNCLMIFVFLYETRNLPFCYLFPISPSHPETCSRQYAMACSSSLCPCFRKFSDPEGGRTEQDETGKKTQYISLIPSFCVSQQCLN